jgi:hypothetical protein
MSIINSDPFGLPSIPDYFYALLKYRAIKLALPNNRGQRPRL